MITIPKGEYETLRAHLEAGYPGEACGILIGEIDGEDKRTAYVVPVRNAWTPGEGEEGHDLRDRFSIDPVDIVKADRAAGKRGLDIIGFFHSHPDWPCAPSETDRMWAWPVVSFVIMSVNAGRAGQAQSWVLRDGREAFDEESLEIV